jgi:polyhydroxyalkanoate synthesis regulator phasin
MGIVDLRGMSTAPLNIRPEDLTGGNPRAASVRLEGKSLSQAYGQRRHDFRIGPQPKYVDPDRKGLNRPLIEPRPLSEIRNEVVALRTARGAKRAMKSNAAVVTAGIITFGIEAQKIFLALTLEQQDAAFRDLGRAVAERLDTSLEAVMVHCDESAIHAHFELRACNRSGIPLAKATRPALMIELQDMVFEVMSRHCPGIERGNRKYDRLAAGEDYAATVHKSVRQLHHDLPLEIARLEQDREALQASLPELTARVDEMRDRVAKLEAEAADQELTAAKVKRLRVYRDRLTDRVRDLEARQGELDAVQTEHDRLQRAVKTLEDRAEVAKQEQVRVEDGARRASERAQEADRHVLAIEGREARLRASEAALRVSEGALEKRGREVERREGVLRGLGQAIVKLLDEASAWLGEAIPASVREAVPALQRAIERLRSEPEGPSDEGPGF